jgi:hypothetical protein
MRNQRGGGCSALLSLIFLFFIAVAIFKWPTYLDSQGDQTEGVLSEKQESIRVHAGEWYRHLEIVATFTPSGQRLQHRAGCDVDEQTYDSLHVGSALSVHYFPNLLNQPLVPATHLSPCTSLASINFNPAVLRKLLIAVGTLAFIFFIRRILRIRIAGLLYVFWIGLFFAWFVLPRVEPLPTQPQPATATVEHINVISTLFAKDERRGIQLKQPYQVVQLKFTPTGMDAPVIAVDKVDLNSVSNLQEGQSVSITYDAVHPRIARLAGGTRRFPESATANVLLIAVILMAVSFVLFVISWFWHLFTRNPAARAARFNVNAIRRIRRGL